MELIQHETEVKDARKWFNWTLVFLMRGGQQGNPDINTEGK